MNKNKSTSWTKATTDFETALIGLFSCLNSGKNSWIEIQKNGEQDFPIKISNPALDNPFNWTMAYGVPRNEEEMEKYKYLNDTEKDLTYNWYAAFSDPKAAKLYQNTGKITRKLFNGMGICTSVKMADIDAWRAKQGKEPFGYSWVTYWKPKDNIPYWIAADIQEVFVACYNDGLANKKESYLKTAELLHKLADKK